MRKSVQQGEYKTNTEFTNSGLESSTEQLPSYNRCIGELIDASDKNQWHEQHLTTHNNFG